MKKIYCIRHCSAQGQEAEAPLTEEGMKQARMLATYMEKYDIEAILSSPFLRAQQTISPLAEAQNLTVELDNRLAERVLAGKDLPDWRDHLEHSFKDEHAVLPGGESSFQASQRALALIEELQKRKENTFVLVTHGNLMALIIRAFDSSAGFHTWKKLTNPDVFSIELNTRCVRRLWV
ncbi:histidine phosphatase family protein [Fictibacillus iocasae]|uniref:Histidine phosphatase family protein n=1 Tax=Fictibacillus iocasae TaxID=2715437 RepID=A0ABW2NN80_9BACL